MDQNVLSFQKVKPSTDFMDEIFNFDVRKLQALDSEKVSQYCIALTQYVVYLRSEMNKAWSEINMKQRFIDSTVNMLLTAELIKIHKSKSAACDHIVSNSDALMKAKDEIGGLKDQLTLLEGQDKNLLELVNAFKRELTRRDNELYSLKTERR